MRTRCACSASRKKSPARDARTLTGIIGKKVSSTGVAGLMGDLDAESGLKANNLQNSGNSVLGMTDEEFTAMMDVDTYDNFVADGYGYGLAKWTARLRKADLLAHAHERGVSVSDLGMQLDFICHELPEYPAVLTTQRKAAFVMEASNVVLTQYERPLIRGRT